MSEEEKERPPEPEKPKSFEENLQRLDQAVKRLEEGNIPLDESLQVYEDGIKAFRACRKTLEEAEGKITKLVETLEGELEEEPFEPPEQSG